MTASLMNTHVRDNLNYLYDGFNTWTTHTPTVTQSGAVTKTTTYSKYCQVGKFISWAWKLDITGSGTIANAITLSVPATAAQSDTYIGTGRVIDQGSNSYPGLVTLSTTSVVAYLRSDGISPGGAIGVDPSFALANTDVLYGNATYQAA